jgi:acyl-CoA thioester hydrolase
MFHHDTQVRVRYAETDQMGYVYYGNYAAFYEVGRAEAIRLLGISYQEMEADYGILMPVLSLQMRFVRPARYDNLLTIRTTLRQMPTQSITFHHEIFNEQKKLINGGSIRLTFVDTKTNKVCHAPPYLTEKLKPFFEIG